MFKQRNETGRSNAMQISDILKIILLPLPASFPREAPFQAQENS